MKSDCVPFTAVPHTSQLFRDYLYDFAAVQPFYARDPQQLPEWIPNIARSQSYPNERRQRVADALDKQNRAFGASDKALAGIERLRRGAFAAVTGQQVGLFGGPLFAILKALSAAAIAERSSTAGMDCVPVFWLATEDHDLAEVNHATLLTAEGSLETLRTESAGAADAPVNEVRLGNDIPALVERATALLGDNDVARLIRETYRPGESLGTAFAKLFARVFAGRGVVLLDASDPALHAIAEPVYSASISQSEALDSELLERGKALISAGYHEQVKVTPASTLLFEKKNGARIPIRRVNGGFDAAGEKLSPGALLDRIHKEPHRFSPNVLLRPVVQDFLLPTLAYIGGPAEVAYFAQAAVVYERLLQRVTPVLPRFSATLLDARAQRLMTKYGLSLPDLFHGADSTRELLARQSLPPELQTKFEATTSGIADALEDVKSSVAKLDPTLVEAAQRAESKMLYQLRRLRGRVGNAELRRNTEISRHAEWLSNNLYPDKGLQERQIAGVSFLARHGSELLDTLYECARSGCLEHQVVYL